MSRGRQVIAVIAVVLLVAVVAALCVLALRHGAGDDPASVPAATPPVVERGSEATETKRPEPTATPSATPSAAATETKRSSPAEERFLSLNTTTAWRATAGSCTTGEAPTVERSTDGGQTWVDVTPTYKGIGQVRGLEAFAQTEAELVADMGDECETQLLRTFTQGKYWDSYPEILPYWTYRDAADAVATGDGTVDAPCAEARSVRASAGTVALVCDATAYTLADGDWQPLDLADALAVAISDGVLVAHLDDACPGGIAVSRFADADSSDLLGCAAADSRAPLALASSGTSIFVWSGPSLLPVE
ncbi:hypothetical protein ACFQRL_01190 [Microbacterium fluvii]|uniref:Uncharacterized protein n=1 Tax=Microbacterium fluvii TaxID=415215 RepID=A0ABW2H974_9MICO|nr:hypothetical protein [Microbacterium fluvii]MCU4671201.1 hypothetical protein [Microbacterium fluvii]